MASLEIVTQGGFSFSVPSVGGTWSWTLQANNVQGAGQLYQFVGITTPYGPLQDATYIPIPADVIVAMADSLTQFQQQLNPMLALVSPAQTIFNTTITEGDPGSTISTTLFQNVGAFGSFMSVTATPDVQWLSPQPSLVSGLGKNNQGQTQVKLVPSSLLAINSPYVGHVNLQDNRSPSTLIPLTFQINVLPRPQISVSSVSITLSYSLLTASAGGAVSLTVQNSGPVNSILNFSLSKLFNNSPWLAFTPGSGGPLSSGQNSIITFSVVSSNAPAIAGTYTENVGVLSTNAGNSPVQVTISLIVT